MSGSTVVELQSTVVDVRYAGDELCLVGSTVVVLGVLASIQPQPGW